MNFRNLGFFTLVLVGLVSCQKEKSLELSKEPGSAGGGDSTSTTYGWSYKDSAATNFKGCIDTAYYETSNGAKVLTVEGTDASGNAFVIVVGAPSGTVSTGTFTAAQGAGMVIADNQGNTFVSATPTSFSITITAISSTEVSAQFSGTLANPSTNAPYKVDSGTLKAVIGAKTPC